MFVLHFKNLIFCVFIAYFIVANSVDVCPQNSFESALIRVCDETKCLDRLIVRGCIGPGSLRNKKTKTVNIQSTIPRLKRGFIHDLPDLTQVSTPSSHISTIHRGAFLNLPKLEMIDLAFNNIEEILWEVFSSTSVSELDISWNHVRSIENQAFSNMPNLKRLKLSNNEIREFDQNWFTNSTNLEVLLLSYNQIRNIHPFSFNIFPNMSYLDLSFNMILKIGAFAFGNIKKLKMLDLSSNRLSWIQPDVFTVDSNTVVEEFRVPLNRLSFLSTRLLDNGHVKAMILRPNPWQCKCLDEVFKWIYEHNATLKNPTDDDRIKSYRYDASFPDCTDGTKTPEKCVIAYDDAFLEAQKKFFQTVNYSFFLWQKTTTRPTTLATDNSFLSWEKPPTERPNFNATANEDLTPIE